MNLTTDPTTGIYIQDLKLYQQQSPSETSKIFDKLIKRHLMTLTEAVLVSLTVTDFECVSCLLGYFHNQSL